MKTSNKLVITLITVVFLGILASSMVLKSAFEKIDLNNPFFGYAQETLEPFRAVKLSGNYPGLVQLQQGENYELLTHNDSRADLAWEVKDDTLVISIQYPEVERQQHQQNYAFYNKVRVNIMAPNLSTLIADGITCKLLGWNEAQMRLSIQGHQRGILLQKSTIGELSASIEQGSLILLQADNKVGRAAVEVRDSSAFTVEYAAIDSLELEVDQTAQVKLPGYLLSNLTP